MSDIPKERTEKLFTRVVRSGQKPEEMTSLIATLFQSSSLMQTQARRKQIYRIVGAVLVGEDSQSLWTHFLT